MPHLRPWKHSFRVHPVYLVYHEGSLASFSTSFAINHVNWVVRGTREVLMDSSAFSSIVKGLVGCIVGYVFTSFASAIIVASYLWGRKR